MPGCRLQLRPHQQRNLSWMRLREAYAREPLSECPPRWWSEHSKRYSEHTRWSRLQGACLQCRKPRDKAYAFDALQGVVAFPNQFASPRRVSGGLLCDEPGLGKTVTIVSLCLREMGALPRDSAWTRDDEKELARLKAGQAFKHLTAKEKWEFFANLASTLGPRVFNRCCDAGVEFHDFIEQNADVSELSLVSLKYGENEQRADGGTLAPLKRALLGKTIVGNFGGLSSPCFPYCGSQTPLVPLGRPNPQGCRRGIY